MLTRLELDSISVGWGNRDLVPVFEQAALACDTPAWHDRPTCPGLWLSMHEPSSPIGASFLKFLQSMTMLLLEKEDLDRGAPFFSLRVYGPIPEYDHENETPKQPA